MYLPAKDLPEVYSTCGMSLKPDFGKWNLVFLEVWFVLSVGVCNVFDQVLEQWTLNETG
jgi:hypothetical protein